MRYCLYINVVNSISRGAMDVLLPWFSLKRAEYSVLISSLTLGKPPNVLSLTFLVCTMRTVLEAPVWSTCEE